MNHIGLLYSNDGEEWKDYLLKLLKKDAHQIFDVNSINLSETNIPSHVSAMTSSCLVTLVLLTPDMLKFMSPKSWLEDCFKTIPKLRSLVTILSFIEVQEFEKLKTSYSSSERWKQMNLSESTSSNVQMVAEIVDLVEYVEIAEKRPTPKKRSVVKHEQFQEPEIRDLYPSRIFTGSEKVAIIFKNKVRGSVQVSFKGSTDLIDTKQINPYFYKFRTPVPVPNSNSIDIYHDSTLIATKPFFFIKPTQAAFQSLAFLMQTLGVNDQETLDQKLCDIFDKSLPGDHSLKSLFSQIPITNLNSRENDRRLCDYPTLLHYSAAHGLTDFTSRLLDIPGAMTAFQIENQHGHNPAHMAEINKHDDLAQYIRDFTDTNAVIDACETYVDMMIPMSSPGITLDNYSNLYDTPESEENHSQPLHVGEKRQHNFKAEKSSEGPPPPPPPRSHPLQSMPPSKGIYSTNSNGECTISSKDTNLLTAVALSNAEKSSERPPPRSKTIYSTDSNAHGFPQAMSVPAECPSNTGTARNLPKNVASTDPASFMGMHQSKKIFRNGSVGSTSQQELIDLQNFVKTDEFSVDEAVQLFNAWKQRPESQSYKDRKKSLEELKEKTSRKSSSKSGGLLRRMMSSRRKKREDLEKDKLLISEPMYLTFPINTNRCSSISSYHNDNSGESGLFLCETNSSDSEPENSQSVTTRSRLHSSESTSNTTVNRKSRRDMYLENVSIVEMEPPPIPARKYKPKSPPSK